MTTPRISSMYHLVYGPNPIKSHELLTLIKKNPRVYARHLHYVSVLIQREREELKAALHLQASAKAGNDGTP